MPPLLRAAVRMSLVASVVALAALPPGALAAQQPDSARAAHAAGIREHCGYDACALRLEDDRLVQGVDGSPVARLGLFSAPLESVIWSSDTARSHAARFSSGYANGRLLKAGSIVGSIAATAILFDRLDSGSSSNTSTLVAVLLGTTALSFVGDQLERAARRELSRAIWWHNRELPR